MRTMMPLLAVAGAALLLAAATAGAHGTPCCAQYVPCSPEEAVEPGANPAEAQCCGPEDELGNRECRSVANAGWRCDDDVAGNAQASPDRQAFAGCIDGESGTCVGGAITPGVPEGCIGVGGLAFITSTDQMGGADVVQCTADAVAACCANDACLPGPPPDDDH